MTMMMLIIAKVTSLNGTVEKMGLVLLYLCNANVVSQCILVNNNFCSFTFRTFQSVLHYVNATVRFVIGD